MHKRLAEAVEALTHVRWSIWRVSDFHGDRAPTFEDLGRVTAFIEDIRGFVEEINSNFETAENSMRNLDYVRIMGNVDPDADDA